MDKVIIDSEKCTGCGSCVVVCPYRVLELTDSTVKYVTDCFLCGHCGAVCPADAIKTDLKDSGTRFEFIGRDKPDEPTEKVIDLINSRRSCRNFTTSKIPLSLLKDLVKIGTMAPSGTNCQAWQFTLLPTRKDVLVLGEAVGDYFHSLNRQAESGVLRFLVKLFGGDSLGKYYRNHYTSVKEALEEWEQLGNDRLFHGATAAILVSSDRNASCPAEDCLLATQNILLAAHSLELGTCLIGFVVEAMKRDASIGKMLKIPDEERVYSVIALGWPDVTFFRPAGRKTVTPRIIEF